jgi:Protein of unknown function (DUF3048) C-terminal domain/Protein of unknown function (DUF3048) N-terminal domain
VSTSRPRRHAVTGLATVTVLLAALAACSGASTPSGGQTPLSTLGPPTSSASTPSSVIGPTPDPVTLPLSGEKAGSTAARTRPVIAAVIAFGKGSPAPHGLGSADITVQEFNPSTSRLVALYQGHDSSSVGPIDQIQPSDIPLLWVSKPWYAFSGGSPRFTPLFRTANLVLSSPGTVGSAYRTRSGRPYLNTATMRSKGAGGAQHALQLLTFGQSGTPLATTDLNKATHLRVHVKGHPTLAWSYDAKTQMWHQTGSGAPKVSARNLIVQRVKYYNLRVNKGRTLIKDPAVYGTGSLLSASGGTTAHGTWVKRTKKQITTYVDKAGYPLRFRPGSTWIMLVPSSAAVSTS